LAVFHFLFRNYSEFQNHILKKTTQGTFLPKISPLDVAVSEKKMLKEKLMWKHMRGHDIRSELISFLPINTHVCMDH
jgi:hypothetical protein